MSVRFGLVALTVIVTASSACAGVDQSAPVPTPSASVGDPADTATPQPTDDASLFDVPSSTAQGTVPVPTYDGDGVETEMAALDGVLSITPDGCTYVDSGDDGTYRVLILWPRDFGAVMADPPRLVDGDGDTVAVDGQTLGLAGASLRNDAAGSGAAPSAGDVCPDADGRWRSNRVVTVVDAADRGD